MGVPNKMGLKASCAKRVVRGQQVGRFPRSGLSTAELVIRHVDLQIASASCMCQNSALAAIEAADIPALLD
jgi:hypothetical protein